MSRALAAAVLFAALRSVSPARVAPRAAVACAFFGRAALGQTGASVADNYPIGGLKCYYSNKKGMNTGYATTSELESILCPEGQNKFCVRQIVNGLARTECGMTEYFGDKYYTLPNEDQECMLLKCADSCVKDQEDVHSEYLEEFRESDTYKRDTLCCQTDYCNTPDAAGATRPARVLVAAAVVFAAARLAR